MTIGANSKIRVIVGRPLGGGEGEGASYFGVNLTENPGLAISNYLRKDIYLISKVTTTILSMQQLWVSNTISMKVK